MVFNVHLSRRSTAAPAVGDVCVFPGGEEGPQGERVTGKNKGDIPEGAKVTCIFPGSRVMKAYPNTPAGAVEAEVLREAGVDERVLGMCDAWGSRRVAFLEFEEVR